MTRLTGSPNSYQDQPRSRVSSLSLWDRLSGAASSTEIHPRYSSSSSIHYGSDFTPASSSNTFGVRTPTRSLSSSGRRVKVEDGFFNHQETPPPLPPLDHPAFTQATQAVSPTITFQTSGVRRSTSSGAAAQTHSNPPVIRRIVRRSSGSSTLGCTRPRRSASKSSTLPREAGSRNGEGKKSHSRTQSKNSLASSANSGRRSSAEYSARQASLIGSDKSQDSWEVQVAKELLRLSLQVSGGKTLAENGD